MTLESFEPASIMYVGNEYEPNAAFSHNGQHLEVTFSFSEDGIIEMDYDAWKLVAVGEGTVDVTVTIAKDGLEPQSLTKTITVYGSDLTFAEGSRVLVPTGYSIAYLDIENKTDKDIDSILWSVSDENLAMFYAPDSSSSLVSSMETNGDTVGMADVNCFMNEEGERVTVTAAVTFADGTEKTISTVLVAYPMFRINTDDVELAPNEAYSLDYGFDRWIPEEVFFSVANSDSSVATVSAGGVITAVAPGEATIYVDVFSDDIGAFAEITVKVRDFSVSLNPSELNLSLGQAAYIVPTTTVEDGYWIDDQRTGFWSTDESVATVDHLGLVTAVAPGSATIGYEAYTYYDDHRLVAYATVNVAAEESGVLAISDSYVELHARESYQLGVCVSDNYIEEKTIESIEWISSDTDWLSVDETGMLNAFYWDIEEPRTVYVTANVTFTDGTTDYMICSVKLLPAIVSVAHSRNWYEIGVEESQQFEYAISTSGFIRYEVFFSVDEETGDTLPVVTVDETGMVTGVNPGVALVRMTVMELLQHENDLGGTGETIYGRSLFTGASYFYVDTPLPEPSEDSLSFEFDHYYLTDGGIQPNVFDNEDVAMFYNVYYASDNEEVAVYDENGWLEPVGEGTTTIRVWLEGYEQFAATAQVTVGSPYVTFDAEECDENGRPVISVGDLLTAKIEGMPPFEGDGAAELEFLNIHSDWNVLREVSRDNANNTITFIAMENCEDTYLNLEVKLASGWHHTFCSNVVINEMQIDGEDAEYFMELSSVVMSDAEIVDVYPDFSQCGVISVNSTNEGSVTAHAGEENQIVLTGMGAGYAEVYAEYLLADGEGNPIYTEQKDEEGNTLYDEEGNPLYVQQTDENDEPVYDEEGNPCYVIETAIVKMSVAVVEDEWDIVSLDPIPDTLYVDDTYEAWPEFYHTGYHGPEIHWELSEEGIIEQWQDENGAWLRGVKTGNVTLSVWGEKDGEMKPTEPLTKEITVTEAPYRHIEFEATEVEVRPGESFFVPLNIYTDWELVSVTYTSEDEGLVTVRNMLDDESYPEEFPDYDYEEHGEAVIITGVAANNSTRVFAEAEFRLPDDTPDDDTDNETTFAYAVMRVHPIEDDSVELHIHGLEGWGDHVRVTNQYWGYDNGEVIVWLDYDTNAAVYGNGEDILTLNWSVDDPNVASIWDEEGNVRLEGYGVPQNGLWITGVNPGGTTLRLNAVIWRHVYDEEGNVQYNEDGSPVMNVLREENWLFWIEVNEPRLNVWFNNPKNWDGETPVYELNGTDNRYGLNWQIEEEYALYPLTEKVWVDDTSIATVSTNGELISVAPGETRVRVQVMTDNGHCVENEAIVRVYGNDGDTGRVDMGLYDSEMTIAAGNSANIAHYLHDNGYTINGEWWASSDENVATVSAGGTVYGVAPGYAVITWHVDTEYGWHEAQCIVEVTGETENFCLDSEVLTLYRGSEAQLRITAQEGYEAVEGTITFTSSNPDVLTVDNEGNLYATDWDNAKTYYITVTAEAQNAAGETMTATALVIVPEMKLRIAGHQFGEGRWEAIDLFDWDNPLTIREQYITSNPDMNVEIEVTYDMTHDYDESGNIIRTYPVIVWDEECGGYIGVNAGETTMHYTVTADSGETYTADMKVFVGQDRTPDALNLREGYDYVVTALGDNNRYAHEAIDWPEYTGCEIAYEITEQVLFNGGDGNVININLEEDGRIYTENAGVATVRAYCPYDESLSLTYKVLVFEPDNTLLTRVDEVEDPSIVKTGDTVHLAFRNAEGGAVAWDELGIPVETRDDNGYDSINYKTSEDGMFFETYFWGEGEQWWHYITIRFPDGYEWYTNYCFNLYTDDFFLVRLNNYLTEEKFVGNPGERTDGSLRWDSSIEEDYSVFWESADESVATVDEFGNITLSADVTFTEENPEFTTEITGIAQRWISEPTEEDEDAGYWEEITRDSFPVRVIPVSTPNFEISTNGVQTVVVGDTLNMWISEQDEKTNAPHHEFISSDEEILAPHLDENGSQYYGEFIAMQPGTVTVTAQAWNGYTEENHQASEVDKAATLTTDTITIHVVAAEPIIWLNGVDMRPGQTYTQALGYEANGSARSIASVEWTMTGETAIATLTPGVSEEGEYCVTLTDGVAGGFEQLTAKVTFADGAVLETTCNVYVRPDDDVWVWGWHDDTHLSADAVLGAQPTSATAWVWFDTQAALTDNENPGTDTASVTWEILGQYDADGNELDTSAEDYQPIVTTGDTVGTWNNGIVVQANGIVGSAQLKATMRIYNAAGEELCCNEDYITVYVDSSDFSVWFEDEDGDSSYDIYAGDGYRYVGWDTHEDNVTQNRHEIFWSDDTSVVTTDIHGNVQVVAPGETDIHVQIIFGEGEDTRAYQADAHVRVYDTQDNTQRVDVSIAETGITLAVGESLQLTPSVADNGVETYNRYWSTNNGDVIEILDDDTIVGLMPGYAELSYCVDVDYGTVKATRIVEVTGEDEPFRLSSNSITLFTEQETTLDIINETGAALSDISLHATNWEAVEAEIIEGEDGSLSLRIYARNWASSTVKYEVVKVTAVADGTPVTATCHVIIPEQRLRIIGDPFEYDGNWWAMASGDRWKVQSKWNVSDPDLADKVREQIVSENPEIACYDEATGEIVAVAEGQTVITYTVWVEHDDGTKGETRTGEVTVFVDMDRTPEDVVAPYDPQVVFLDWGERNLNLDYQPEMTHTYTEIVSLNPEILTFDDENDVTKMTLHSEGMAYVDVMFPENDELNFTARVLVIDQDNVQIRRVDEGMGAYHIGTLERAHIAFTDSEGNAPIWEKYDINIPVEYEFGDYDPNYVNFEVDENNQIFLTTYYTHTDSSISHLISAKFNDGLYLYKNYEYWIDPDVQFTFAFLSDTDAREYVGVVGERSQSNLGLCSNYDGAYSVRYESENTEVAAIDEGGWIDLVGTGETVVHAIASNWVSEATEEDPEAGYWEDVVTEDGYAVRASFPVRVLEPYAPTICITAENDVRVLNVGDILQLYIYTGDDPSTYVPAHAFESCDTSILTPVLDENGEQLYGQFEAIAPGRVTVNATAWNSCDENGDPLYVGGATKEFIVVGEVVVPSVWMETIFIRPGQTVYPELSYNDNETGLTISSVSYTLAESDAISLAQGEDGSWALTVNEGVTEGIAELTAEVTLSDGSVQTAQGTVQISTSASLTLYNQNVILYVDAEDGATEADVWLDYCTNAAFPWDDNPGTDSLSIEWTLMNEDVATLSDADDHHEASNNGVRLTAKSADMTVLKAAATVKDADGNVLATDEIYISVTVCEDNVDIWLVEAPEATEYVGNVGDAVQIQWATDTCSSESGLPEGYSVWYAACDEDGMSADFITVDQYGWFYPQMDGDCYIEVGIDKPIEVEEDGVVNTYYCTVAAGRFPVRVIEPEAPDVTITCDLGDTLTVGETVNFGIAYNNSNTFAPWYYFENVDSSVLSQVYDENGKMVKGQFEVVGVGEGSTSITVVATYGTSTANQSSETTATFSVVAGSPELSITWDGCDMRPGQTKDFPLAYSDNASGAELTGYSVQSSNTDIATAELVTLESGEQAVRVVCLSAEADADVTVTAALSSGETLTQTCTIETIANSEVTVEAEDTTLAMSDAAYGEDPYETYVFVGYGTNAAVSGDPNRDGTDYAEITDWQVENPEDVTVITTGETIDDNGNGLFVRAEAIGTAMLYATVNIYAEDGTFLAQDTAEITVTVSEATFTMSYMADSYGYLVNRSGYPELEVSSDAMPDTATFTSSDERIFTTDAWGNISARSAGEATLTATYTFGSKSYTASTKIIVYGVQAYLEMNEMTLAQGESMSIPYTLYDNGYSIFGSYWESANEDIATVTTDGKVYAVAPGTTAVTLYVQHNYGTSAYTCVVYVTGEETGFTLSENAMTVYLTNTAQLAYSYEGEGTLESVTWSVSDETLLTLEENETGASVTANWVYNIRDDQYASVSCEAQVNTGTADEPVYETVTDSCQIIIPAPKVWINGNQFGEGSWIALESGDWMNIWETYGLTDSSLTVTASITVDDEEIAVYEAEGNGIRALAEGKTTAHYTITASNGESYTRDLVILVDQDITPAEVKGVYAPQVADLSWGTTWFEVECVPQEGSEYADCSMQFESLNPEILFFEESYSCEMTLVSAGLATVQITCPDNEDLNTTAQVLVVDTDTTGLIVLDSDEPYMVNPFEATQLGFRDISWDEDGNMQLAAPVWEREGVEVSFAPYQGNPSVNITDDLMFTAFSTGGTLYQSVEVVFNGGQTIYMDSDFSVNGQAPYLILVVGDMENELVANPGDGVGINCWHNLDNASIAYESSDDSVATVDEYGYVECKSVGEATITAVATLNDGEATMQAELAVRVIAPETPNVWIEPEAHVVKVGQNVSVYMNYDNANTFSPSHSFVSLNTDVLEQAYDEYGNEQYGTFYAKALGEATIRLDASYGSGDDQKTAVAYDTIRVIPGDPEIWLEADSYTLRPGQTRTMTVCFADNGSGLTLAEDSFTCWVDYGDSVTVSTATLEDGSYTVAVTAKDTASSPLINVKATLSDGSEVTCSQWMDMVADENVYVSLGYNESTWINLTDEEYGCYDMTQDIWLDVGTNAYLAEDADTLEITWTTDDSSIVQLDDSNADEYGNGMRFVAAGIGSTYVYANATVTAGENEFTSTIAFYVNVWDAVYDFAFAESAYTVNVGAQQYISISLNQQGYTAREAQHVMYSKNEAVAYVSQSNFVFGVAPGTTEIVYRVEFSNGAYVEKSVPVTVIGATAAWADEAMNEVALKVGETFTLEPVVTWADTSLGYNGSSYWENTNENVVSINTETGEITALNPGTAVVSYWQNVYYYTDETQTSAEWGECFVYSTITVTGEEKISLSETQITLAGESTHQLELTVNDETLGEPVSVSWSAGGYASVDENGLVSVTSQHRVFYGTVTATATFADDSQYTAYCSVTVNPKQFYPLDWQFGEGYWTAMDYNATMNYCDVMNVFSTNVIVEKTFVSSNTAVATVDAYGNIYTHDTKGHADITMTLKGYVDGKYTGESYVRSYRVRVDEDTLPTWISVANGARIVAMKQWGSAYINVEKDPYTACTIEYASSDESIASFDWGNISPYIFFHDKTGTVTVDMVVPDRTSLNTSVEVVVADESALTITDANGSTAFTEGEEVQLVISGQTWADDDVERIEWWVNQYDDVFTLSESGMLTGTVNSSENGNSNWVYASIHFKCGNSVGVSGYFDIISSSDQ